MISDDGSHRRGPRARRGGSTTLAQAGDVAAHTEPDDNPLKVRRSAKIIAGVGAGAVALIVGVVVLLVVLFAATSREPRCSGGGTPISSESAEGALLDKGFEVSAKDRHFMCGTSAPSRPPVVAVIANDERSLVCLVYGGSIYGPKPVEETTSGGTHFDLANLDCEIVPTSKMPVARIGDLQIAMESLVGFR